MIFVYSAKPKTSPDIKHQVFWLRYDNTCSPYTRMLALW